MLKRILVVDDVKDWQKTLSGLLIDEGYEVIAVGDRESALEAIGANRFNLAIIDIRLDETNEDNVAGLDLTGELKKIQIDLPVVIITGYETQDSINRAMQPDDQGQILATDFVLKTDVNELVNIVNNIVSSSEM